MHLVRTFQIRCLYLAPVSMKVGLKCFCVLLILLCKQQKAKCAVLWTSMEVFIYLFIFHCITLRAQDENSRVSKGENLWLFL